MAQNLLDLVDRLVDDRVGVIRQVEEVRKEAGASDFLCFSAQTANVQIFNPSQHHGTIWGTGVAADRARAMTKAIGEAIERYCGANFCPDEFPVATYESADYPCVEPNEFALFSTEQYREPGFPYIPFDRHTPIRWVSGLDLYTGEQLHLPASMVFLGYACNQTVGEQSIAPQISTGLACHTSPIAAALSAICEVIERDALTITWQAILTRRQIDLNTLSARNASLVKRLRRPDASITLLHLNMDHDIPAILSLMRSRAREAPALMVAAAANLDPELAVQKSLEELAQSCSFSHRIKMAWPDFNPGRDWEHVVDPESHAAVYFDQRRARFADFLVDTDEKMAFSDIDDLSTGNSADDLRIIVEKVQAVGHRVLVADVTTEDIRSLGLWVLRAIVPGFHPLFIGHRFRALGGTRLWTVPQKLGYTGITFETGDNPYPNPFA